MMHIPLSTGVTGSFSGKRVTLGFFDVFDLGNVRLHNSSPSNHALCDCLFVLRAFFAFVHAIWVYFKQSLLNLLLGNVRLRTRLQVR